MRSGDALLPPGGGEEEEFDSMSTEFNAALFISVGVYMTRT